MGQQQSHHLCNESKKYANQVAKYELLSKISITQPELCQAIAISQDNQLVVAACNTAIKVFDFSKEVLKPIVVLNEHSGYVDTLIFMHQSNSFISSSSDNSIIIWSRTSDQKYISQQKLFGHTYYIRCLILNIEDNLIISSGCDNTIRIWKMDKDWKCQQIIADHSNWVFALSLEESSNTLISCGHDKFILIFRYSKEHNLWIQIQRIQTETGGFRLSFTSENCFSFQPLQKGLLSFFIINDKTQLYQKKYDLQINGCEEDVCYFPLQYLHKQQILIAKNGCSINILKKDETQQFKLDHSIKFQHNSLFGSMSSNGYYLITWDNQQKQLQVRKAIE
ncbi:unnamed protein product [Paramecium octaurelia]|uniref:Uncharacterized protein n=1 Tax=Paramecium octaurelia TaxID=43137 RepID=A0A8S1WKT5_PAROT|nr:unnamed protein product [Paramecium octaurelia]